MASLFDNVFDAVTTMLILTWMVGAALLMLRASAAQSAYFRRLPPIDGLTVNTDTYAWNDWSYSKRRALRRQMYGQRQADPELEQLRQDVRWHSRYLRLWMFGFPFVMAGVLALIVVTGHAR